jgi:hypothetical protein
MKGGDSKRNNDTSDEDSDNEDHDEEEKEYDAELDKDYHLNYDDIKKANEDNWPEFDKGDMKKWYRNHWDEDDLKDMKESIELREEVSKRVSAYWNSFHTYRYHNSFEELVDDVYYTYFEKTILWKL